MQSHTARKHELVVTVMCYIWQRIVCGMINVAYTVAGIRHPPLTVWIWNDFTTLWGSLASVVVKQQSIALSVFAADTHTHKHRLDYPLCIFVYSLCVWHSTKITFQHSPEKTKSVFSSTDN